MFMVLKSVQRRTAPKAERNGFGQVKLSRVQFEADDLKITFLEMLVAKATHFDGHRFCQLSRQIANVHPRAAIDVRRIFVSQEQHLHAERRTKWRTSNPLSFVTF